MPKLKLFAAFLGLAVIIGVGTASAPIVLAQQDISRDISLDENVQPTDLGITEPGILPDSPFYFLKNWAREIQSFFTFNPVAKMELSDKFASEKLMELKKMSDEKKKPEAIEKATENYQKEIARLNSIAEKVKKKAGESPKIETFLEKYTRHQLLHQRILQKLENQVPAKAFAKIEKARKKHLENFKDVMLKLENRDKIPIRIENNLKKLRGSKFRDFKDMETLEEIGNKFPEDIRQKIEEKRQKIQENFHNKLENMLPKDQEELKEYTKKINGDKLRQLRILGVLQGENFSKGLKKVIKEAEEEKLKDVEKEYQKITANEAQSQIIKAESEISKAEADSKTINPEIYRGKAALKMIELAKNHLERAKTAIIQKKYGRAYGLAVSAYSEAKNSRRIINGIKLIRKSPKKIKEKFEKLYPGIHLSPNLSKCKIPSPPVCQNGRVVMGKDSNGCPVFKCKTLAVQNQENKPEKPKTTPNKPESPKITCPMVWDPVCGENGKTYSNKCVAENIAKTKISHKGICKQEIKHLFEPTTGIIPGVKEK